MSLSKTKRSALFADAYNDLYPLIFSMVQSKINNRDDAEDICQEVFYKFYQKIDEIENYRKWLYGTLRLQILEYYRKKKKKDYLDIDEVFNDVALTFANGFRDIRIIISEAIENDANFKDNTERAIFELIAVHNYTYKDTAKELGLTLKQVRYRYAKIVARILDHLKKRGISSLEELL